MSNKKQNKKLDRLHLCISCYSKVLELRKTEPYKITKEQIAGGTKMNYDFKIISCDKHTR